MKSICMKSNNKYIIDYLLKEFSSLELEGLYLSNSNFKIYENVIAHYGGEEPDGFEKTVCDILTRSILFFYERKIVKNSIYYNYFYFNDLEKKEILEECMDIFLSDDDLYRKRYNKLYQAIKTYLQEHHAIVLEGFVNFRIQEYKEIVEYYLDICVSNFLIEREYYEFINILQLYVNSKESQTEQIHLVYVNKESILIDENKNIISVDDKAFSAKYLSDISFSSNDYCLNTLLTLLPKKLDIHLINGEEDEFITTLKLIFEQRVTICNECDICRVYRLTNNVMAKQ